MQEGMFARMVVHSKKSANGAPGPAFFGLPQSRESVRIERAEATLPSAAGNATLKIEGTVTVPQAFSVFISPVAVKVGNKSFSFKMDRRGSATTTEGKFTARNSSQYGVVYGGLMQFEASLSAPELAGELRKLSAGADEAKMILPLTIQIGRAEHTATARVVVGKER
jgi:hypothetical protein